jgi:hypothetical protein
VEQAPPFDELMASAQYSAVHLEMRDSYTPADPIFLDWKAGKQFDPVERMADWFEGRLATVARGVVIRRARIVSEPLSDFTRHEFETTSRLNIPAGEQVRWLPRRRASDLALPGNDFWVFDDHTIRFGYFAGDGELVGHEVCRDPDVLKLCLSAFEAVWDRAIPHEDYRPS